MKHPIPTIATAAIIGASSVFLASPVSAHTPGVSASCDGIRVQGSNYEADKANLWSVTVGGTETHGTFAGSLDHTVPVPQGGATTTWSAYVEAADGGYHGEGSGTVGPCGEVVVPPKPKDDSETRDKVQPPNCELRTVTTDHQERSRTYTLVDNEWVAGVWSDWTTTSTDTRDATGDECLTTIAVPAEPKVTDKCGPDNAAWVIPADGGGLHWVNEDGFLNAVTDEGYVLADGKFYHEFGIAPESNTEACPAKTPPTTTPETPETAAVLPDTGSPASFAGLLGAAGLIAAGVGLVRKGARA
jgi:LPXTG-motif cell wall-anchored protein